MVDGPGGRVRPVVAARDGHRPAERGDVPVDGRRHLSAGREPDPDLPAMILAALRGVQSLPQLGIGEAIDLAADVATRAPESSGICAEIEEEALHLALADVRGTAREEPMQAVSAHQRAVDEEQLSGHADAPRSPA